jgi:hypothetical protein
MKLLYTLSIFLLLLFTACSAGSDRTDEHGMQDQMEMSEAEADEDAETENENDREVLSPPRVASAEIGESQVTINYSAPSVRGRVIWGELVPYGRIWVSGAHMATTIEFEDDMLVNGVPVPAGKYAFFTIPGDEDWTVILNENWDQHQAGEYDEALDAARFELEPSETEFTEQLSYIVIPHTDNSGVIELAWEELKISLPVRVP